MATLDEEGRRVPPSELPEAPGSVAAGTSGDSSDSATEIGNFNISNLPFVFNPPMHKSLRFFRTNLGGGSPRGQKFYDEASNKYEADAAVRRDGGKTGFENLRLGRIIMDDMAVSKGIIESGNRFGFRFLYNPNKLGGGLNVGTNFIPNQQSAVTAVLQTGLEKMRLEVLLNRIPDINGRAKSSEYMPSITDGDRKRIQEEGTHYDLDFLYRCANGIHNTRQRSQTGDIGVLLPNPCRLILGPYTSRGAIVSVQVSDQMFSRDMVPILSYVNIEFARFLNMTQDEITRAQSYGISQEDDDSDSGGGGGGGGGTGPDDPGGPVDTGKQPRHPITFSGVHGTSSYGHEVHAAVAAAFPWQDRPGGFGTRGSAGNHGHGRALDIMQTSVQPKTGAHKGWGIANFLKGRSDALYVTQIIWQQKIWTTERKREGWRPYGDHGNDNDNHFNHVHVSFGPGSGNDDFSRRLTLMTDSEYWK